MTALLRPLVALLVFALLCVFGTLVLQALLPTEFSDAGFIVGGHALLANVAIQSLAAFAAGALMPPDAGPRGRLAAAALLWAFTAAVVAQQWQAHPSWVPLLNLVLVIPMFAVPWRLFRAG